MSVNYLASGSSFNEWTPDLKTVDGVLQVDESKLPELPEGSLFVIKGLTGEVNFEKLNRTIRNGDLIWFTTDGEIHSYSSTGSTNKYKDLSGKPILKSMAFVEDVTDDIPKSRIKGKWVPDLGNTFLRWDPVAVEGDFAAYCTTYVPKEDEPITGVLSQIGNRLDVLDFNTGNTDHITQYVLGKQNLDTSQKIALYFKFPNVPQNFNAIDLSCGFYRTPCGLTASPLQQEKLFITDGMVVANEIVIDGFAGVNLPNQLRRNYNGQLKDLEFCIVWEPTLNAWTGNLSLYISQQKDIPLASVAVTDFFVDSLIMGLNISIPTDNIEVDASIEILTLPTVVHTGLAPFVSSNEIIPIIFEDSYPEGRFGRLYEIFGLSKPSLLAELNILVNNGDIIWFGSDGKARQFFHNGFSGKWVDLQGVPNFSKVALSNSYLDLFDLPHLGTASEKDIEYFTDLIAASLLAAKTHTDNEVSILNSELNNKVDKETGKGLSTNDYTNDDKSRLTALKTTVSQDEAEAGTSTVVRAWTAQRVRQAIAAWWNTIGTAFGKTLFGSADASVARQNLELGTTATKDVGTSVGQVPEFVSNGEGLGGFGYGRVGTSAGRYADVNDVPKRTGSYLLTDGHPNSTNNKASLAGFYDTAILRTLRESTNDFVDLYLPYHQFSNGMVIASHTSGGYVVERIVADSVNLRTDTGQSTLYAMTQKAVTDALEGKVDKVQTKEVVTANKTLTAADNGKLLIINSDGITITMPANSNFTIDIAKMDESFTTVVQCAGTNKFREGTASISVIRDVSITNSGVSGKEWLAIGAYEV